MNQDVNNPLLTGWTSSCHNSNKTKLDKPVVKMTLGLLIITNWSHCIKLATTYKFPNRDLIWRSWKLFNILKIIEMLVSMNLYCIKLKWTKLTKRPLNTHLFCIENFFPVLHLYTLDIKESEKKESRRKECARSDSE
jgi:hypothetical protein